MERRTAQVARREEFDRVPGPAFVIDLHTVHVCAGPGARHTFCGKPLRPGWGVFHTNRWQTDWELCGPCGETVAELDGMVSPR